MAVHLSYDTVLECGVRDGFGSAYRRSGCHSCVLYRWTRSSTLYLNEGFVDPPQFSPNRYYMMLAIFLLPLAVFEELTHEDTLQLVWEGLKRILPQGHSLQKVSYPDLHPTLYHPHPSSDTSDKSL